MFVFHILYGTAQDSKIKINCHSKNLESWGLIIYYRSFAILEPFGWLVFLMLKVEITSVYKKIIKPIRYSLSCIRESWDSKIFLKYKNNNEEWRISQITVYNQDWLTIDCQGTNLPRSIQFSMDISPLLTLSNKSS